jgi:hypothetical protein
MGRSAPVRAKGSARLSENFLPALILAQEAAAGAFGEIICALFHRRHCLGTKKPRQLIIRLLLLLRRTQLSRISLSPLCIVVATKRGCNGQIMRSESGFLRNYQVERSLLLKLDWFAPNMALMNCALFVLHKLSFCKSFSHLN